MKFNVKKIADIQDTSFTDRYNRSIFA